MVERFKRKFTEEERVRYVNEALECGSNILISKKYNINYSQLSIWLNNYRRYGKTIAPKEPVEKEVIPNYKKEYDKIKKELDAKELEINILRDLLKKKNQL